MFIYKITNLINNKVYIGQTNNWKRRKAYHISKLKNNDHPNRHLQLSINKYNIINFTFEILENDLICPVIVDYKERFYIKHFNSTATKFGYNKELGGREGRSGKPAWNKGKSSWSKGLSLSIAHKLAIKTSNSYRQIKVICSNGKIYNSIADAAKELNTSTGKICAVMKGTRTHTKGHTFKRVK